MHTRPVRCQACLDLSLNLKVLTRQAKKAGGQLRMLHRPKEG
jgi:hypothetical protein